MKYDITSAKIFSLDYIYYSLYYIDLVTKYPAIYL